MITIQHLHLEGIKPNPHLGRLLPSDVAFHYHALPVAADNGHITIAIANPDDKTAIEAVIATIGPGTCFVHADQHEIDCCLAEIWMQNPKTQLRLLLWTPTEDIDPELILYSKTIADLLQAELNQVKFNLSDIKSFKYFISEATYFHSDLIIFQIPHYPSTKRLLIDFAVNKLIDQLTASILVVKNPRLPIQRILLAIRDGNDPIESAVDWVVRLAHCTQAEVTILPLLPPLPQMYGSWIHYNLPSLLTSRDPLGQKMRWIANRLADEEVEGAFKIREEPPLEQLRYEVADNKVDLVVIKAEPHHYLWRWLIGEVVNNLFEWFDRPLLITQ